MIETTTVLIGKCEENNWRRENLLKSHNCIDKGKYYEISFQWIEHVFNGVKQFNLIYQIIK